MSFLSTWWIASRRTAFLAPHAAGAATPMVTPLPHRAVIAVNRPSLQRLTCLSGALWITVDGMARDVVLEAGDSFEAATDARVLVYALEASRLLTAARSAA